MQQSTNSASNPFSQMNSVTSLPYSMTTTSSYIQPTVMAEPHSQQAFGFNQQTFLQPQQPPQQPMSNPWPTHTLF